MTKKRLDLLISEEEAQWLEQYCQQTGRSKTDVLRECIRSLKRRLKPTGKPT